MKGLGEKAEFEENELWRKTDLKLGVGAGWLGGVGKFPGNFQEITGSSGN